MLYEIWMEIENKGQKHWSMKEKLKDQLFLFVEVDFVVCKLNGMSRDASKKREMKEEE